MTSSRSAELREFAIVLLAFAALTALLTFPLAFHPGSLAYRVDNGDGQFSIWNVAWVARTLVLDPLRVFDANIFYPHRMTLAYSEANLGSGALAIPVYWATRNPYAAHAFVVLLSFLASAVGTYYLVRYLVGSRTAAIVAAIGFGFCPHVFSHLLHIQLLWTAGLPISLLAFHRLVDRSTPGRGAALGLAMSAQLYLCAYYAVFLVLIVGGFALFSAGSRRLWRDRSYSTAVGVAAVVAVATALPLLLPYAVFQRSTGFVRPLGASDLYSADWQAYFASSAYAHGWMLPYLGHWNEVLFPGFIIAIFAVVGLGVGVRASGRVREATMMYAITGALALWASFGPQAGLYRVLYATVPAFTLMRAPSRFGVVVLLALAVLAGVGVSWMLARVRLAGVIGIALIVAAIAEHAVPLGFQPVPTPEPAYRALAALPRGALIEMPVFSRRAQFLRARYMLASTIHWMPIVNAYSDYIPPVFEAHADALGGFPSTDSFARLKEYGVRYAMFHLDLYGGMKDALEERLEEFAPYLVERYSDETMRLYEIVGFPGGE
jgi:hypothetical protein